MSPVDVLAVSIGCKAVWEKFHISYRKGFEYPDAISMFLPALAGEYVWNMRQEQRHDELYLRLEGKRENLDAAVCLAG